MGTITIDEKNLPPVDDSEIRFAKQATDATIDTSDIPELTSDQLREIAALAKRKREPMPTVALRIPEDVLMRYKALGKGYTSIMADILTNAVSYF